MPKEKYTPTPEEMQKAEEMMTPEQKKATEEREKFFIQEQEAWDDEGWVGKNEVRKIPDGKEQKRMDEDLKKLGSIFRGSNVRWQLDGASNISLMKGDYIGVHKDTDISVEPDDLEALDAHLSKKGYGLFLSYVENPDDEKSKKLMKRVGARGLREASGVKDYMIAAIDERGKILKNEQLNFIDTHLIQRNADEKPLGYSGAILPEEWLEPQPMEFNGETVNLSHPARVAYYKLHMTRKYDTADLMAMVETGKLSIADMDEIETVIKTEVENYKKRGAMVLRPVWEKINKNMSADDIFGLFSEDPNFSASINNPEGAKKFRDLSEHLAKAKGVSFNDALEAAVKIFKEADSQGREERIYELRKKVEEVEEKNKLRENI